MTLWNLETTDACCDGGGWYGNYSWVQREAIELPDGLTDRQVVRRLRAAAGLNGSRAITESYSDGYMWKHPGAAILTFAMPEY